MRLLFQFHYDKDAEDLTELDINNYIIYIKQEHKVGFAKCKMVANALQKWRNAARNDCDARKTKKQGLSGRVLIPKDFGIHTAWKLEKYEKRISLQRIGVRGL